MNYEFTILGSGTSYGVPMIGCHCDVCTSNDPRDRRTRAAGWLHGNDLSVIFDFGTDLREQVIRQDICTLDAAFLTHNHADHLNGIDDLRSFSRISKAELPIYATAFDIAYIRNSFSYMFNQDIQVARGWDVPHLTLNTVDLAPVYIKNVPIQPIPLIHGHAEIRGYRIGDFAYLTDCSRIPDASYDLLRGLRYVVIDGLRWRPHDTHFNFEGAIAATAPLQAEKVYLTHLSHNIKHAIDEEKLPPGVHLAYDGLTIPLSI